MIFLDGSEPLWLHLTSLLLGPAITLYIFAVTMQRKNQREIERRHKENQNAMEKQEDTLKQLQTTIDILPLHGHTEDTGPLHAEGVYRRRNNHSSR